MKPGRYEFQAYVRAQGISTDEGVAFRVASDRLGFRRGSGAGDDGLEAGEAHVSGAGWGRAGGGAGGADAVVAIRQLHRGTLWIDQVSIVPAPGMANSINARMCQAFCVNGRFFLAPQAVWAVGKWESWFWISTFPRPTVNSSFWSFCLRLGTTGFRLGPSSEAARRSSALGPGDPRLAALVGPLSGQRLCQRVLRDAVA